MKPPGAWPAGPYDVVYADPPWHYYGSPRKDAAAGKHYALMSDADVLSLPVRSVMSGSAALFLWATCPRLDFAIDAIRAWGLHYRGVAFVWVKTNGDGLPIAGQGVPPTFVKPTSELVLAATTGPRGRPFPISDYGAPQVLLHPRTGHSRKPPVVRALIERLCGDRPRLELFAREPAPGWDRWGDESELFGDPDPTLFPLPTFARTADGPYDASASREERVPSGRSIE